MDKPENQERISLSFYAKDLAVLSRLRRGLIDRGLRLDSTKVLRALIHSTSQDEFLAHAILQWKADEAKPGPRETDFVDDSIPSIWLPSSDVKKLDDVSDEMDGKGMPRVKRSYIVRARLRHPPALDAFYADAERFLATYPDGRTRAARSMQK